DICEAIIKGTLNSLSIEFAKRSTVCKYVVPENYPENPAKNVEVDLSELPKESDKLRIFRAAIDEKHGATYLTGSRTIAFVGVAEELGEAEKIAEQAARTVKGPVYHRSDIGSHELIESKKDHMRR